MASADKGVDITARKSSPYEQMLLIQAKRYRPNTTHSIRLPSISISLSQSNKRTQVNQNSQIVNPLTEVQSIFDESTTDSRSPHSEAGLSTR